MTVTYGERQAALVKSLAGQLAIEMAPGTRWQRPEGDVVTVWMGWSPDPKGSAASIAKLYNWAPPGPDHNTEIGVTSSRGTERVKVADVGGWVRAA